MSKELEALEAESQRLCAIIDDAHKKLVAVAKQRDAYLTATKAKTGGTVIEVPVAKIKAKG